MSTTAGPEAEGNFTPAGNAKTGVNSLRAAAAKAREDHYARMTAWRELALKVARPRWVIVVGAAPAPCRHTAAWRVGAADRWQVAANVAFAFAVLLVTGLLARLVLGKVPLMPIAAIAAAAGALKLARIQLATPAGEGGCE